MRLLQLLALALLVAATAAPLAADAIVSSNWSACGETKSESFTDPVPNYYGVSRVCDYGAHIDGYASADPKNLSVDAYAHVNGAQTHLEISAGRSTPSR